MASRNFVGRGWKYPLRFDSRTGGVSKDQGDGASQQLNRVRMSLFLIASIKKGELYFGRRFGSRFRDLLFTLNTSNLVQRLKFEVFSAFEDPEFGERRAVIDRVSVLPPSRAANSARAEVEVFFVMRGTYAEGSFVFPFYLQDQDRTAAERDSTNG